MTFRHSVAAVAVASLAFASPAMAATYTYSTHQDDGGTSVGTKAPDGHMIMGSSTTGTHTTTWADGSSTSGTWSCVSLTNPPHAQIFNVHIVCDITEADGTYTAVYGCAITGPESMGCSGGLYGKTGRYEGKRGAVTWMGNNDTGSGVGQWDD